MENYLGNGFRHEPNNTGIYRGSPTRSTSQKSYAYGKDPHDRYRASLPHVNPQISPRYQEEDDPGVLPSRRQKYLPDKYNSEEPQINPKRSNPQYPSGYDGYRQGENRPLSRSSRARSIDHLRPYEYREAHSLMDDYGRRYEHPGQRQNPPGYMSPDPYARRSQYPEDNYNPYDQQRSLDTGRRRNQPYHQSSVDHLPVFANAGLQTLLPNLQQQQNIVSKINKQAKLLENIAEKLQKAPEKETVNVEKKLKEFEENLQLKAILTKQQEQIDKMELMNLLAKHNINPASKPEVVEKKKSTPKKNVNMHLLREQMLAQQNQFLQTMLWMEMLKQNQPPPMVWPMDYNPYPQQMPPTKRPRTKRLRKYLWAIAYPELLDNFAESEVRARLEDIRKGLSSIREKTEQLIVAHFVPIIQDNMIKWRDEKNLIYQNVCKPNPTDDEIEETRADIEDEIVKVIKEIFDRTTTAAETDPENSQYDPQVKDLPESFVLYLGNFCMNKVLIPSGIMDLFNDELEQVYTENNEEKVKSIAPANPLFAPGSNMNGKADEEEVINGLYTKQEIRAKMKSDIDYNLLKKIFLGWSQTLHALVGRTWQTTAVEINQWKKDPKKKKAYDIAKKDPLLKNAVFRAVLRPI